MSIQDNGAPPLDRGLYRQNIRQKVTELLKGATLAEDRVYPNASILPGDDELPALLVYYQSEAVGEANVAPREYRRDLSLHIEIVAKGPEVNSIVQTPENNEPVLSDILDTIIDQIECIFDANETLGDTCDNSLLTGIEFEFESAGGIPIGSARMTYTVSYITMAPRDPKKQGKITPFDGANVDWSVSQVDDNTREAQDTIDLDD